MSILTQGDREAMQRDKKKAKNVAKSYKTGEAQKRLKTQEEKYKAHFNPKSYSHNKKKKKK